MNGSGLLRLMIMFSSPDRSLGPRPPPCTCCGRQWAGQQQPSIRYQAPDTSERCHLLPLFRWLLLSLPAEMAVRIVPTVHDTISSSTSGSRCLVRFGCRALVAEFPRPRAASARPAMKGKPN
uniref:Uncharacterized protein n=1 Tax=Anopheles farauti TaxID=69004 RepID=A0A182QR94_9DIPT